MNRAERRRQAKRNKKQKSAAGKATPGDSTPSVQVLEILKPAIEASAPRMRVTEIVFNDELKKGKQQKEDEPADQAEEDTEDEE